MAQGFLIPAHFIRSDDREHARIAAVGAPQRRAAIVGAFWPRKKILHNCPIERANAPQRAREPPIRASLIRRSRQRERLAR
jgi:hypothetical protein